jgi:hypothetical protein
MNSNGISTFLTSLHCLHQSRFLRHSEGRLWVLRTIRLLKTSFKRIRPIAFFYPWFRKLFRMVFGHLETSLHRLHQSRFSIRSEGKLWVLRAIRLLITSLKRYRESHFLRFPKWWKWLCMTHRHLETSLLRLRQSRLLRRAEGRFCVLRAIRIFKS